MKLNVKIDGEDKAVFSYSASFLFHAAAFIFFFTVTNIHYNSARINSSYIQITAQELAASSSEANEIPKPTPVKNEQKGNQQQPIDEEKISSAPKSMLNKTKKANRQIFYSFSSANADTNALDQIYHESTLNVTMKYPAGWIYIDQDVKNKLDGVTFWSTIGNYTPPPYIHLEVRDKDLFSESRYRYKSKTWAYTIYYNDPEELESQITQTFYIRTNSDEDFSLKLIMKGEEAFKSFQPIFFGIIKSFRFGSSLF